MRRSGRLFRFGLASIASATSKRRSASTSTKSKMQRSEKVDAKKLKKDVLVLRLPSLLCIHYFSEASASSLLRFGRASSQPSRLRGAKKRKSPLKRKKWKALRAFAERRSGRLR
uniref:Uncharacterized protein n=1 Tax=Pediastrum duplex TaxID=3105 RepID=A0A1W5RMN7_PEDDU|nr:hypothetical protein [Pediastrum duplex]AQU64465.1 hypothetical protein [Pediastrum duplex]